MSRLSPLVAPYADDVQASFDAIMPPGAPPLLLFRTLARSPRAWRKFRAGSLLDRGPLSLRQREIVIDRVCARAGCGYEWGVHVAAFAKAAWEEGADLGNLKGQEGRLPWSRLKLTGKQPFEIAVAGNPEQKNIEGATEVWVSGHPDNKVAAVFVWRAPAEVLEQVKFDDLVRFTAASVIMNPLADAPAAADPAAAPAAAPAAGN
jgi:hypothetical protein